MSVTTPTAAVPPASRLGGRAWGVLALTLVFWVADGYDTFILLITAKPTLTELLPHSDLAHLPAYLGYLVAITLAGWATGGILGGLVGDRIGRRKTMIIAVVIYSVFTALSAITWSWETFGLARFLTGVGIGAEWGVGTSLLQEVWPERWRTRGAGLLQAGFSVGGLLVSALWVLIGSSLGQSWRWMYLFGVIPLVIVLLVRKRIPESQRWASAAKRVKVRDLLKVPVRRNFLAALATSIAITGGWWAVSSYLPSFVGSLVTSPTRTAFYTGWAGALYNLGEIFGCVAFGFAAEYWGRKASAIVYFIGCVIIVPIVFLLVHDAAVATWLQLIAGFLTGGIYSWYTVHTPELFSTAHRATAISAVFSGSRYLAMVGAVLTGTLSAAVGGFGHAAALFTPFFLLGIIAVLFLPETRGKKLPE